MIRHYCDSCGKEVTVDTGVVKAKELTIEEGSLKVSVALEIETVKNNREVGEPALCARCISGRLTEWAVSVEPQK